MTVLEQTESENCYKVQKQRNGEKDVRKEIEKRKS